MRIGTTALYALAWLVLFSMAAGATDDIAVEDSNGRSTEIEEGRAIDSGVVILDGRYLPLPYIVGHDGEDVYVNGHLFPRESLRGRRTGPRGGREPGEGMGPRRRMGSGEFEGPGRRGRQRDAVDVAAGVEDHLMDDSTFIAWEGAVVGFIPCEQGFPILDILLSNDTKEAKVQALMERDMPWISSAQWERLVDDFRPTAELSERALAFAAETERLLKQHEAARRKAESMMPLSSGLTYGINLTGILLAVFALGSLLTHRPQPHVAWREIDTTDGGPPLVVRNITLVVVLGLFDMGCTLIAGRAGGLWELNPLAAQLVQNPIALAAFKVPLLVGSAAILISLRRYHGAQVASWWMCLVCTVLTFRWATYNSMFLS